MVSISTSGRECSSAPITHLLLCTLQDMPVEGQSGLVHITCQADDSYIRVRDMATYTHSGSGRPMGSM